MSALLLLQIVGLPFALGWVLLVALGVPVASARLSSVGWAWVLGSLATAGLTLLWLLVGLGTLPPLAVDGGCLVGIAALAWRARGRAATPCARDPLPREMMPPQADPTSGPERTLFVGCVALALAVTVVRIVLSSRYAILANDEAIFWSFRAKLLFENGGLGAGYIEDMTRHRVPNAEYPWLNPLLQTWVFAHAQRITHVINRVPLQLFQVALICILAGGLRRWCRPALAGGLLLLTLTMTETLVGTRTAQSDVIVACAGVMALDAWLRWHAEIRRVWVALAACATGLVLWGKLDGLILSLCAGLAIALSPSVWLGAFARRRRELLWCGLPAAVFTLSWSLNHALEAQPAFGRGDGVDQLLLGFAERFGDRLPVIAGFFVEQLMLPVKPSNWITLAFLLMAVVEVPRWWRGPLRVPTLTLLIGIPAYMAVFILVPSVDVEWHLNTAASRLLYHLSVPMALWLGVVLEARLRERP